ncbi:Uncharacterised protein [Vibrio cholerae]|uniref:Uncharacterized protein n=1 Tax=Vibrio cholerae TaxID=666 RepID=A0A655ZK73_VIBCL|nr:Uncharacterised protein [Vibrio cholerae]
MVFRAVRDDLVTTFLELRHHGFGVFHHTRLILFKLRLHRFFERHRFCGNHVHQRTALAAREYCRVQLLVHLLTGI